MFGAEEELKAKEKKRILKERGQTLARPKEEVVDREGLEIIQFFLDDEKYGIESKYVSEICPLQTVTPLPCTPSFIVGIINLRGKIFSVMDMKILFALSAKELTNLSRGIIIRSNGLEFCIKADIVTGIRIVYKEDLQPSLPTLTGIRSEYLMGITRDRVAVLNVEKIAADDGIIVNEEVEL